MSGIAGLDGLRWHAAGYATLSGALAAYLADFDSALGAWAQRSGAGPMLAPSVVAVETLDRCGYLDSFPHIASVVARYAVPEKRGALRSCGCLVNPAACYHVYASLERSRVDALHLSTLTASCQRAENHFEPLRRQANFRMREIVAVGEAAEVKARITAFGDAVAAWCEHIDLTVTREPATDPFFLGDKDAKFAMQRLGGRKTEITLACGLAIGSLNYHGDFFGRAFDIATNRGVAHTGCIAFGLERWLYAMKSRFGTHFDRWPLPELRDV